MASTCTFSILIGLVSTEDSDRILETLDALRAQIGDYSYEVNIADRRNNSLSERIRAQYPEVRLLTCPPDFSLPELRTHALDYATGNYVVVTEDHCVPPEDWLHSFATAFETVPQDVAAVGGCVENGVCDTGLDWSTFLCEYSSFVPPIREGYTSDIPGMNVAYRRSIIQSMDRKLLLGGFWETTVHPVLIKKKYKLYSSNRIRISHRKKFSFTLFSVQRFFYSRYYAGRRFKRSSIIRRGVACAGSLALPPLLIYRITSQIWSKRKLGKELIRALPSLSVFVLIWALGEMVGYAAGSGNSLARIE